MGRSLRPLQGEYTRNTGLDSTHAPQFANNIQLRLVLPPEPRRYWDELAEEHKKAPEHLAWQYSADPFAARKMVDERQAKATQRREEREAVIAEAANDEALGTPSSSTIKRTLSVVSKEFEYAPEVRMSSALRVQVESAITKVRAFISLGSYSTF